MVEEFGLELILSLIKSLAVPGNTTFELTALVVLLGIMVWRKRKK